MRSLALDATQEIDPELQALIPFRAPGEARRSPAGIRSSDLLVLRFTY